MNMREDFEESASQLGYNLTMYKNGLEDRKYMYRQTQDVWEMWQECCALKAKVQPIGVVRHNTPPMSDNPDAYVEWLFGGDTHNIADGTRLYTRLVDNTDN